MSASVALPPVPLFALVHLDACSFLFISGAYLHCFGTHLLFVDLLTISPSDNLHMFVPYFTKRPTRQIFSQRSSGGISTRGKVGVAGINGNNSTSERASTKNHPKVCFRDDLQIIQLILPIIRVNQSRSPVHLKKVAQTVGKVGNRSPSRLVSRSLVAL